ncbi:alpha/beta fold hydrolase [Haloarcula nitratireducens]|uniref:Alpha/beta hydrolase n=1 Tax=Haloarcula nitratireducens TaxID=2487749 RepID=A0AAW4PDW6_9EURY|nr:alpha/beta hydrolase [Halomicroarcula nitratireducens]MBX0295840.1 alpha/beta hydrolase [Halomicroarcula nitratireducens]
MLPVSDWTPADAPAPSSLTVDGRRVAYATYGDPEGTPVIFAHGTPGSRLLGRLLDEPAAERGLRLVAPDRPGIGRSDDASVGIEGWPADVAALLDPLDVDAANVVGFSGGAPFALACHRLERVARIALVGGSGPPGISDTGRTQRLLGTLARYAPPVVSLLLRGQRWALARRDPSFARSLVADGAPATDALSADEVARLVRADVLEAMADGPDGVVRELGLLARPWPFDLEEVTVPVTVFQGQRDTNVAPSTGERLAAALPEATLETVDADHLGTLCRAGNSVLRAVSSPTRV